MQSGDVEKAWDAERELAQKAARSATKAAKVDPADAAVAQAAQYDVDNRRYRAESAMNFWVGYLYEVRVAASTAESDRHRTRSERFFYAMLAAQLGAVVSSLALARKRQAQRQKLEPQLLGLQLRTPLLEPLQPAQA